MKHHAYNPLRVVVETARDKGIDVDVFLSTSIGIVSIVGRIDTKDSGSKVGITVNGYVVNTLNPLRPKPNYEDYGTVSYMDMTWNPSTATTFIVGLINSNKSTVPETVPETVTETVPETVPETVKETRKVIRRKKKA